MTPKELAKKVRYIQIQTNRAVNDVLAGEYLSAFKGAGMEFEEVREYQPGDEVRSIDWNVTARQGRPYVKRFHEERELTVMFAVDMSGSGQFGSTNQTKNELSAEKETYQQSAVEFYQKYRYIVGPDAIERFKEVANAGYLISYSPLLSHEETEVLDHLRGEMMQGNIEVGDYVRALRQRWEANLAEGY